MDSPPGNIPPATGPGLPFTPPAHRPPARTATAEAAASRGFGGPTDDETKQLKNQIRQLELALGRNESVMKKVPESVLAAAMDAAGVPSTLAPKKFTVKVSLTGVTVTDDEGKEVEYSVDPEKIVDQCTAIGLAPDQNCTVAFTNCRIGNPKKCVETLATLMPASFEEIKEVDPRIIRDFCSKCITQLWLLKKMATLIVHLEHMINTLKKRQN